MKLLLAAAFSAGTVTVTVTAAPAARPACPPGTQQSIATDRASYGAYPIAAAPVYRKPNGPRLAVLPRFNANGYRTVFGVLTAVAGRGCTAEWYGVELPMRPNGATGYVRARDVFLYRLDTRIVVDLSARRLVLYRGGKTVLTATVAIGKPSTPTPTGRYYVDQRLIPTDPSGAYGPYALGISAFSNVLQGWTQGGPIGIHGTNEPELLGQAVTHGCIRVRNDLIARLFALARAGTPVVVRR
jgi:lipoprotein-anchoring transpeptidase ErfK/SrfK